MLSTQVLRYWGCCGTSINKYYVGVGLDRHRHRSQAASLQCSPFFMWRVATIARAAFGRPLMGTALSRGLVPPMLVKASAITLPAVQKGESPFKGESLKVALGPRLLEQGCSLATRLAPCTTTSRAPWRTARWSTRSLPQPTRSRLSRLSR